MKSVVSAVACLLACGSLLADEPKKVEVEIKKPSVDVNVKVVRLYQTFVHYQAGIIGDIQVLVGDTGIILHQRSQHRQITTLTNTDELFQTVIPTIYTAIWCRSLTDIPLLWVSLWTPLPLLLWKMGLAKIKKSS
jgi:hypothetical protein